MSKKLFITIITALFLVGSTPVFAMAPEAGVNAQTMCHICYEFTSENMAKFSCGHQYCKECFTAYIDNAISQRNLRNIRCPHYNCYDRELSAHELEAFISKEQHAKINDIQTQDWLSKQSNIKHCPTPDCKHAFINESGCQSNKECPGCHIVYCTQCMSKHPDYLSCDAARDQLTSAEDKANHQWKAQHSKQCPECHTFIEKNNGCDHMTCSKCRYEFCWKCLQKYPCDILRCQDIAGQPAEVHDFNNRLNRLTAEQLLQYTNNVLAQLNANPAGTDLQAFIRNLEQFENPNANIEVRADMPRDFENFALMLQNAGIQVRVNLNGTIIISARMPWDRFNRILDEANTLFR